MVKWLLFQLVLASVLGIGLAGPSCNPTRAEATCRECINLGPTCAWCKALNFTKAGEPNSARCDSVETLKSRGCQRADIINPQNDMELQVDKPLVHSGDNVIQIKPQKVKLFLRRGSPQNIEVKFKRAEGYPVDLYYLMDLSYSMKDDLENVKKLGGQLLQALRSVTKSIKIGFGSFVDKTVLPFVNTHPEKMKNPCPDKTEACQPPFDFRHILKLTDQADTFTQEVGKQSISGNLDPPEAGLDAMMQAAVCGEAIGWRNVTRLLVYTSDDGFHFAGDGKLGAILTPNDGQCHLNKNGIYEDNTVYDYPSIAELASKLAENNIQPIFAVTTKIMPIYQELSKMIPKSAVGELKEDSSNVVQLIKDAYNNLSATVILAHKNLPDGVQISYTSHCSDGDTRSDKEGTCSNVKINTEISFTITVTAEKCLTKTESFEIRPLGFTEKLEVSVQMRCGCKCDDKPDLSSHCNNKGTVKCGVCSCTEDRIGKFCECDPGKRSTQDLDAACRKDNTSATCSNQGDCVCGACICHTNPNKKIYGQYCECDDQNCERNLGKLCAGHGKCDCGKCQCDKGFGGTACECADAKGQCAEGVNGTTCSKRGTCTCNECKCLAGYQPPYCKECPGCPSPCPIYVHCIECLGFSSGPFEKNCTKSCKNIQHRLVDDLNDQNACKEKDSKNCWMNFLMKELDGVSQYEVMIKKKAECPEPPNVIAIVAGGVAGVLLIGLLILMVWKLLTELYDRREYKKFEKEKARSKWNDADNPLFKKATTTVLNPNFNED
ncbi:integrin beta-2 isoform X3 [Carcharodon carcharias]|nr:integrin beta-2 isoform X3 [Carcharodon carcharias]XP_041056387.1 integrin beta-2 isoform X3 [Carcharodon carcharias]XP_041056388.1 integrin beta-2 isoform X3 [Carcharodon carcharias]XP_041056389.1 integrin beta-2 isoform X3 [Carcharodon carcharias]XP_041056390.1 integrin beta-2 isoform X3 [Carcharodon carcharias]XP_041056392.1 integrin beta-2 isoform X3 [Carcharodon carcharias]